VEAPWRIVDLGLKSYREVWDLQLALVEERKRDAVPDTLLLVEHPHVITLGRGQQAAANVLAAGDVEVVSVERGGDVTYHGPGQLVAYPIMLLRDGERDLHRFLRNLEQAVIATCAAFELAADREPGKTGVWTGGDSAARPGHPPRRKL
jgi:lipoyl(octanoyl) transferase